MTSTIKVNNVQNQCGTDIVKRCGATTTVGSGAGNTVVVCGSTVTIGRCGGTVALASGASQTGFGRTGTVDWQTAIKTATFTAVSGEGYFCDTATTGAFTLTLPSSPSVGDIVALKDKHLLLHPKEGNEFVKENYPMTQVVDFGGKLWIVDPYKKDHPGVHQDPMVTNNGLNPSALFNMMPIQIPEGEYFMMGDNRDHSNDSRFWGTVPYKYIVGTPWFIYFSWDENYEIRWDRVLRTVESLEADMENQKIEINHKEGIY